MNVEFKKFVKFAGSQRKAAELLDLSPGHISQVVHGSRGLSPEVALKAEKLSEGAVSKEKLIWGQAA